MSQQEIAGQLSKASRLLAMLAEEAKKPVVIAHHSSLPKSAEMQPFPVPEIRPDCRAIVVAFAGKDAEQAQRFLDHLMQFFEREVE